MIEPIKAPPPLRLTVVARHPNGVPQKALRFYEDEYGNMENIGEIEYYEEGSVRLETWRVGGLLHRVNKPAEIGYYQSGLKRTEYYYNCGVIHRKDGPARLHYDEVGSIVEFSYYSEGNLVSHNTTP